MPRCWRHGRPGGVARTDRDIAGGGSASATRRSRSTKSATRPRSGLPAATGSRSDPLRLPPGGRLLGSAVHPHDLDERLPRARVWPSNHAGAAALVAECEKPSPALSERLPPVDVLERLAGNPLVGLRQSAAGGDRRDRQRGDRLGDGEQSCTPPTEPRPARCVTDAGQLSTSGKQRLRTERRDEPRWLRLRRLARETRRKRRRPGDRRPPQPPAGRRCLDRVVATDSRFRLGLNHPGRQRRTPDRRQCPRRAEWSPGASGKRRWKSAPSLSDLGGYAEPSTKLERGGCPGRSAEDRGRRPDAENRGLAQLRRRDIPGQGSDHLGERRRLVGPGNPERATVRTSAPNPTIAANGAGDAVVACNIGGTVSATYRPAGGRPHRSGADLQLAPTAAPSLSPPVAVTDSGDGLVAWTSASVAPSHIAARGRRRDAAEHCRRPRRPAVRGGRGSGDAESDRDRHLVSGDRVLGLRRRRHRDRRRPSATPTRRTGTKTVTVTATDDRRATASARPDRCTADPAKAAARRRQPRDAHGADPQAELEEDREGEGDRAALQARRRRDMRSGGDRHERRRPAPRPEGRLRRRRA